MTSPETLKPVHERRRWLQVSTSVGLAIPAVLCGAGLYAIHSRPSELIPGGPLLLLMLYSLLVLMTGSEVRRIDRNGFHISPRSLPCGVPSRTGAKESVQELFPWCIYEMVARGYSEYRYYASVELTGGRAFHLLGPFPDWAGASEACQRIARLWGLPRIGAGRNGFPKGYRDGASIRVVIIWGLAYLAAFAWAILYTLNPFFAQSVLAFWR